MAIEGVSLQWVGQFGLKVLQRIKDFCLKNSLAMDTFPANKPQEPQERVVQVGSNYLVLASSADVIISKLACSIIILKNMLS